MKKHIKFLTRCILFVLLLGIVVGFVNKILVPKYYFNNSWPTTATYTGFYEMDENSIDVFFLGSSHAASCFNPQVMYNERGIKSYSLACEQQNIFTSYYWLREALKYQKPKVVLVDVLLTFRYFENEPLNSEESCTRKAFDAMKWSAVKIEAVKELCCYDENQTELSYYLPNIRYHARWTELGEEDFRFGEMSKHYELKGFAPLSQKGNYLNYKPFVTNTTSECAEMDPIMQLYLDKIVELCKENNIELVLVKTPSITADELKYNTLAKYAEKNEIRYWDFNEKSIYEATGIVYEEDMNDEVHTNIWGAEKISKYTASRLCEECGIVGDYDEQWESTDEYYQNVYQDCKVRYITDIQEYLEAVNQERYTILIAVRGDGTEFMTDDVREKFKALGQGLKMHYEKDGSYWAVVDRGNVLEDAGMNKLTYRGSMRDNLFDFEIISGGMAKGGDECSIIVDSDGISKGYAGINIVVYNNETMKILDSVCYNGDIVR